MLRNDVRNRRLLSWFTRRLLALLLVFSFAAGPLAVFPAYAAQSAPPGAPSQIDAVLVLDVSNSMKTSDKNNIAGEAMKMFIDMLSARGDKVGVVAYTDKVQREKALLTINSPSDKQDLKDFIVGLDRGSYTDIAVGVDEAVKVLENGSD
uniref:vWA domain-containing protein n=1 Tax=Paenibacillus zanthoxyli TaxID=369399 RepID=UPI0005653196